MIALLVAAILAVGPVDWDRSFSPVTVDGFTLESCEGDAPVVCVTDADTGTYLGHVEHLSFATEVRTRGELKAFARSLVDGVVADRSAGCPPGYRVVPRPVFARRVAGEVGVSYGFTGYDAAGVAVERTYAVALVQDGRLHIVAAAAYDDGACLENLGEFSSVDDLHRFEPVLRAVAAVTPLR